MALGRKGSARLHWEVGVLGHIWEREAFLYAIWIMWALSIPQHSTSLYDLVGYLSAFSWVALHVTDKNACAKRQKTRTSPMIRF